MELVDFSYSTEQEILRETIRDFALREIAPHSSEWDEKQHFPADVMSRLGEIGMMGILVPPEYGGAGLGYVEYVVVLEELARVDGAVALSVAAHNSLCTNHLYLFGNEDQKQRYLPGLASGEKLGAWALTEPGAGSDAGSASTRAERRNGCWVLNGTKNFCTHGTYADVYLLMALTGANDPTTGISAFVIEKGTEGLLPGKKENKLGCRASDTASVILDNCTVPENHLVGEEGRGFKDALAVLDGGRISIAAMGLGIAQASLDASLNYSKEREQFGQPIGNFQAIQWKLADMETRIEAARLLTYRAAWLKQQKKETIPRYSSMAKLYASEVAVWAAEHAIQIHGGYGYLKDYPPEKYWRDAKLCTIGEGTSEIQRLVIARDLLK
jgi:alkylation response protein AidB-like acyl-CoA dehydrogenase